MSSKKMILLKSSDGETFQIGEAAARKLQIVAHMMEDNCADEEIPLANVTGKVLARVIEYCNKHVDDDDDDDDVSADSTKEDDASNEAKKQALKDFDQEFVKEFDFAMIFELLLAANYLNIKDLLDLLSQTVADNIKDKTVEEVRTIFNVENDYTPEEEAAVREENKWAFESS